MCEEKYRKEVGRMAMADRKQRVLEAIDVMLELSGARPTDFTAEEKDGQLIETIVMPTDEDTLRVMIDQGILPVDNEELTQLSLDATVENLESSGWTVE